MSGAITYCRILALYDDDVMTGNRNFRSQERKCHGTFVPGSEKVMEHSFSGTKMELSLSIRIHACNAEVRYHSLSS